MAELGLGVNAAKCSEQPGTHKALFKDLPLIVVNLSLLDFPGEGELHKSRVLFCLILCCSLRPSQDLAYSRWSINVGRSLDKVPDKACVCARQGGEAGDSPWWRREGGGGGWRRFPVPSFSLRPPSTPPCSVTHGLKLLVWIEAGLSSSREVAKNPERVPSTALVGIDPVFPCRRARWGQ